MTHDRQVVDALAAATAVGTVIGWLPALAALLTIIWTFLRILEMDTTQRLIAKLWGKKRANELGHILPDNIIPPGEDKDGKG